MNPYCPYWSKNTFKICIWRCGDSYPASDAGVLRVVLDRDGECVFGYSLSVQRSVDTHHARLRRTWKRNTCAAVDITQGLKMFITLFLRFTKKILSKIRSSYSSLA